MDLSLPDTFRRRRRGGAHDGMRWYGRATVAKYLDDDDLAPITSSGLYGPRRATPYEVLEGDNLLLTTGATLVLQRLGGISATALDATNGRMCVGDSATAASSSQTDLQAATNKFRQVVDAAPVVSGAQIQWVCTFGTGVANFAWNECGLAPAASGANLVNRLVQSFGTKVSLQWILTFTVNLA